MARPGAAARRYAEAAFELAARDGSHDRWAEDLRLAAETLADRQVAAVVDNPAIPLVEREKLLERLLGGRISRPAFNLVRLLTQRARIEVLASVAAEFRRLLELERGVVAATVTSAAPLTTDEVSAIERRVTELTGRSVSLTTAIDEQLIGGLTVRVGDQLIDASVRGRLERLRETLVAARR